MFIENENNKHPKLSRSEISWWQIDVSLLRSFCVCLASGFYRYFVPTGLLVLVTLLVFFSPAGINSHASGSNFDSIDPQNPQVQMQFPEGLDYGKFQHSSQNHARLPC